jgi:hypothetical protein
MAGVGDKPVAAVGGLYPKARWFVAEDEGGLPVGFVEMGEDNLNGVAGLVLFGYAPGHGIE